MTIQQILDTFSYFSNFNFPLTFEEIELYLFSERNFVAILPSTERRGDPCGRPSRDLREVLAELISANKVVLVDGFYGLSGVSFVNRKEREATSLNKIEQARQIFKKVSWWPWLQGVLVTGSTAAMNAVAESDIDVLIITSKDALWLTRFFVVIYLKLTGVYRTAICPNIWITDESLEWGRHDLPTAVDAVLTKPIVNKNNIYERFLSKNNWITSHLPNVKVSDVTSAAPVGATCLPDRQAFMTPLKFIDTIFFKIQLFFMKSKVTSEEVTLNKAHFKKVDNHQKLHPHIAHPTT